MKQILYALAVYQEDSGIVEHLGKVGDMVLFHSFTGISKLQLSLRIWLLADLAENHI